MLQCCYVWKLRRWKKEDRAETTNLEFRRPFCPSSSSPFLTIIPIQEIGKSIVIDAKWDGRRPSCCCSAADILLAWRHFWGVCVCVLPAIYAICPAPFQPNTFPNSNGWIQMDGIKSKMLRSFWTVFVYKFNWRISPSFVLEKRRSDECAKWGSQTVVSFS